MITLMSYFRNVTACFFLLLSILNVKGQVAGLTLGLERSPQLSWLQGLDAGVSGKVSWGNNFGLLLQYGVAGKMALSLNALSVYQKNSISSQTDTYEVENRYFKFPLMLTYVRNPMAQATFIGKLGPQVSFLDRSSITGGDGERAVEHRSGLRKVNWGMAVYGGFRLFIVDFVALNFGVRLDGDFSPMAGRDNVEEPMLKGARNRSLSVVFGVNILNF